jgi:hypothetical protein
MSVSITDRNGNTKEAASPGMAGTALGFGIAGTALGLLKDHGILDGILGGGHRRGHDGEDLLVAGLMSKVAMLESEKYTDHRFERMMERICRLEAKEDVLAEKVKDSFEDARTGDRFLKEWVESHFAHTRQVIPADEIVDCDKKCRRGEFDNRP